MSSNFKHFARLLVDIDISVTFPETLAFERDDMWSYILVGYEKLPAFCSMCNSIGHVAVDYHSLDIN